ncbi:MAG: PAS domain S-box protein [Bacteroidota bacterium]
MNQEQKKPRHIKEPASDILSGSLLQRSEIKHKHLLSSLPIAVYTCNRDGMIDMYNDAAVELWGRKPEIGKDYWCGSWKIFRPDGSSMPTDECPMAIALKEGKKVSGVEIIIERPDGDRRFVVPHPEPIFDNEGNVTGAVNTLIDITTQKQLGIALEDKLEKRVTERTTALKKKTVDLVESEERYHKMIDEVQDYAILMLDQTGVIINWNKGVQKIKGYTANEIVGKNFSIFYKEEDQISGLPNRLLKEARENGRALHEGWRVRKDGTFFWGSITITALHNNENEVIGYTKVTRDLTERKNAEEHLNAQAAELFRKNAELKSQKEFVEVILNSSVDIIAVFDKELRYVSLNKQAMDVYKRNDLVGKKVNDAFPQVIESGMYADLLKALEGETIQNFSYQSKVLNKYFENYYIPLKNDFQEIYGVLAIGHDNSTILEAAEKVKIANAELEKKNKELERSNDSLEQFAYVSSHDLQEPLRKIQTFSDLIMTRINEPGFKPDEYLTKINASANRMSLLINDLLNFSRLSKADDLHEKVDLEEVLDQITDDFELLIKQKNAVIKKSALPIIEAIPIQMNQLFYNMISNALKFSEKDPVISISGKIIDGELISAIPQLDASKSYLHLNFKDNGIGFDQAFASQIFTIFQRLNNYQKYNGNGIGLAICKKIVDNHGGYITALSKINSGTSFDIYLPV